MLWSNMQSICYFRSRGVKIARCELINSEKSRHHLVCEDGDAGWIVNHQIAQ